MLGNQEQLNKAVMQRLQSADQPQLKQKSWLEKFGISKPKEKQPIVQRTDNELEPKEPFTFFKKKVKAKEFGYDREIYYNEEIKKSEELLQKCKENLWFEPKHWKANNIKWKAQLSELERVTVAWANIRKYRIAKAMNEPVKKRTLWQKIRGAKNGS